MRFTLIYCITKLLNRKLNLRKITMLNIRNLDLFLLDPNLLPHLRHFEPLLEVALNALRP